MEFFHMSRKMKSWFTTGIVILAIGIIFGMIFPPFLKYGIGKQKTLKNGTPIFDAWKKFPFSLNFEIYVWNVTNPREVENGEKPILKEIGPYVFHEWREKINLRFDPNEDSITYNNLDTFIFDPLSTHPLTGQEEIVVPHLGIWGMAGTILELAPGMMKIVNRSFKNLYNNPESIFAKTTAMRYMFDGLTVNCTRARNFAANALCDEIKKNPKGLVKITDDLFALSLFGSTNGTASTTNITVLSGRRNPQDGGRVIKVNNQTEINTFQHPCNKIEGYDGTIFPPQIHKQVLWTHVADACKSFSASYVKSTWYKGVPMFEYEADMLGDETSAHEACRCKNMTYCLRPGAVNLFKCIGAPIILTYPHFYQTDCDYRAGVIGLNPDREKHASTFLIEPMTGAPVWAKRTGQFNIFIRRIDDIPLTRNLSSKPILMPVAYIIESVALNDTTLAPLKNALYMAVRIASVFKFVLTFIGSAILSCIAIILLMRFRGVKAAISRVQKMGEQEDEKRENDPKSGMPSGTPSLRRRSHNMTPITGADNAIY